MTYSDMGNSRFQGIAFIGTYLPRECGIATFTSDLAEAVAGQAGPDRMVMVAAMNDIPGGYPYPDRVKLEIRADYQADYYRAADFLNFSRINVVCLQHEFGIFGGKYGANILTFLRAVHKPLIVTCHTVLRKPDQGRREVFSEIIEIADKVVVLSQRAGRFLQDVYGTDQEKIAYIPHGIHDVPFIDPSYYKDKFGVEGRRVLLTFGLLHRNKGIENVIEALPGIVERHPKTIYVVLGATHPAVLAMEGESYRLELQRRVRELGLEKHVLFQPRFMEVEEILEYLGATDIFVTPYLEKEQISSGTLTYAMGSGKAVISTPYWYAEEMLADGRGLLVPFSDPGAIQNAVNRLLDDEVELGAVRKRAYNYCRNMIWPAIARSYLDLFDQVRKTHRAAKTPKVESWKHPMAATDLPQPRLDHLLRLTDDTGPAPFARHMLPDRSAGYRLGDGAAALVAAAKHHAMFGSPDAVRLVEIYLELLQTLALAFEGPAAGMDYSRRIEGSASPVDLGKTLWSLGYVVSRGPDYLAAAANDLFNQVLPDMAGDDNRGCAYCILGACDYLRRFPGASQVRRLLSSETKRLVSFCTGFDWYEKWKAADWPLAVQALMIAGHSLADPDVQEFSMAMVERLMELTDRGTKFEVPDEELESPVMAATFIEAVAAAYYQRRDIDLLQPLRAAADWFLGANSYGLSLYDFSTGGCHDALTNSGLNLNQGVEATTYCLIAFLTLHRLSGLEAGGGNTA
ncbi:MAG: glycosyltransferase [Deltaproteobacteria bacterium]|nr:glycosyltransferase [Deltaproteobacteria bacterium]